MEQSKPLFSNRKLFQLLWPLLTEQFLNVLVGMVDVVMVASIGETAVSGVSLVDALNMLMIQFLGALTAGGTVVCSQYIGMKNMKKASQTAGQLFLITIGGAVAIVIGFLAGGEHLLRLIFGAVEADVMKNAYLYFVITTFSFPFLALYNSSAALFRAKGNSRISMKVSLLLNGMNVVGNAFCIYVLKMGVAGVAVPTLVSRMTAAVLLFLLLQRKDNEIRVKEITDLRPQGSMIRSILGIGIPGGIESGMFQFGKLMLQSLVSTLGTASIAGYAVAGNLVTFLYLPGNSLGLGLTTVVGQCVGAGEAEQAKDYTKKFVLLNYAFLAVLATGLALGRYYWIGFYNLSPDAVYMASGLVLSHSIMMIIWPLGFLIPHAFRAANDVRFTMIVSITCMWLFRVALAYVFVKLFNLSIFYVWYAMYIDWVFRVIAYLWRLRGFTERIRGLKLR
ncbi:MAG: MATE family efflux transporter [Clostridiales bacterium]|nr:MATE family efflux transporter [Candidatus Blautia equi]